MTVIDTLDFNAASDGAYSASAPWTIVGAAPTVGAAAAAHGAKGAQWATTGSSGRLQRDSGSNQTTLVLSFYARVDTFSSVNHYIAACYSLATGGSLQGDVRINTGHTVSIRNGSTAVATSSATLSTATWYRFEWKLNAAADTQELRCYVGESSTPLFTLSGAWSSDLTRVVSIGPNVAAAGGVISYDTIRVADDWTGAFAPPPSHTRFRYDGSTWVPMVTTIL